MVNPQITVRNMELTTPIKDYAANKIGKYADILEKATHILVEVTELMPHRGVAQDFVVEINVKIPNTLIRVAEKGGDVYALIDKVSDQLARKIKRYEDKFDYWKGEKSLSEIEADMIAEDSEEGTDVYQEEYQISFPEITKRTVVDTQPMTPEEAIERMELTDGRFWMFRNVENGEYSVVYKRATGGYGILEPTE